MTPEHVRGTPELIIEIASRGPRKRDETIKRSLYDRVGMTEYWVVDPAGGSAASSDSRTRLTIG